MLYCSAMISFAMLIPSVLWTLDAKMSTVDYHGSRIMIRHFQFDSFIREVFGSFAYNNPLNVIMLAMALLAFRGRWKQYALVLWLGLPLIFTVLFLSLFNDTLPHWSGPAYTTLILITASWLSNSTAAKAKKWIMASIGLTGVALLIAICIINFWPGTLGNRSMPDLGKHDVTLDMNGWRAFGKDFRKFYNEDSSGHNIRPRFIFSNYWFPAAHLDFYVARPSGLHVKAVGAINDIHHFAWLNKRLPEPETGEDAYYIGISNFNDPIPEVLKEQFTSVSAPVPIPQFRSGKKARYFYIYRLNGYKR